MTVEVNPIGRRCGADAGGLSCLYCYLPGATKRREPPPLDLPAVLTGVRQAKPGRQGFSLFGGEPLLASLEDLKALWAVGLEEYGKNGVQTSGRPITETHFELFKQYKVNVGFSIDGPGVLNSPRWAGTTEATTEATAWSIYWLERCLDEGVGCSLITTLHRANAVGEQLRQLIGWFEGLREKGLQSVCLHLLERDGPVKDLVLSEGECLEALLLLRRFELTLDAPLFPLFREILALLRGQDSWTWSDGTPAGVKCVWRACDPWTTPAVRGIGPDGTEALCQRVHKDGYAWLPSTGVPLMRQLALKATPQREGGCEGCRFLIMCKGQCPGTSIDGDWRNRTVDCSVWKGMFEHFERALFEAGETPVSQREDLPRIEGAMFAAWELGVDLHVKDALSSAYGRTPTYSTGHGDHGDHGDHNDGGRR